MKNRLKRILKKNKIEITRPFFSPREELDEYIDQIYKNQWLTNDGPLVKKMEKLALISSGTMALQIILEMLPDIGEVITTPYNFVATTSAIQWQANTPTFADIDPRIPSKYYMKESFNDINKLRIVKSEFTINVNCIKHN